MDRGADHRHVLLQRDHSRARLDVPGNAAPLPCSLDEDAEDVSVAHHLPHPAHRLAVGLAAPHRQRAEAADHLSEPGDPVRLDLG